MVKKGEFLYEGKAKRVYRTDNPELYWLEFKDDATAFDGKKKGTITDKGYYNAQMSAYLFNLLEERGVQTHFVEKLSERELLVKGLEIIPVEIVVRNIVAGSLVKRLGVEEGTVLNKPVLEFYYKSDELNDPMINEYHIDSMGWAEQDVVDEMKEKSVKINEILKKRFQEAGILLVDFKLEYGLHRGKVLLGDEISPDTCRFWDQETKKKLDKDRFRRDMGGIEEAYREVCQRLGLDV